MRQRFLCGLGVHGFHRLAYREWGDPANPRVLICVHGLTRNGRDFDVLASALADRWRVVCPDMPGRGESEWLHCKADYTLATYMADCAALIARLDVEAVDWLGTSMGGIIGVHLASLRGSPIRRLVVNDVGPFIPAEGMSRIGDSVGTNPHFSGPAEAEAFLRLAMAKFGIVREDHWRHVVEISTRPAEGGGLRLHYDPGIAEAYRGLLAGDVSFWPIWEAVRQPVLVLRGADSDILLPDTAGQMATRHPQVTLVEFPGCGHAPALMEEAQIVAVRRWLESEP